MPFFVRLWQASVPNCATFGVESVEVPNVEHRCLSVYMRSLPRPPPHTGFRVHPVAKRFAWQRLFRRLVAPRLLVQTRLVRRPPGVAHGLRWRTLPTGMRQRATPHACPGRLRRALKRSRVHDPSCAWGLFALLVSVPMLVKPDVRREADTTETLVSPPPLWAQTPPRYGTRPPLPRGGLGSPSGGLPPPPFWAQASPPWCGLHKCCRV